MTRPPTAAQRRVIDAAEPVTGRLKESTGRDMMTDSSTGNDSALEWFKSSYSTNDGPECVEIAFAPKSVRVRDSKHRQGPQLAFQPQQWAAFLSHTSTD